MFAVHRKDEAGPQARHVQAAQRQLISVMQADEFTQQRQAKLILRDGRHADQQQVHEEPAAGQQKTITQSEFFSQQPGSSARRQAGGR